MGANNVSVISTFVGQPGVYGHGEPRYDNPNTGEDGEVPVVQLDQRHPEFDAKYEAWVNLSLLYEGGAMLKARAERILKKRPREDEEVYAARLDRFTYQNILGTALGWYGAALFDVAPEVFFTEDGKKVDEFYAKFLEDCDGIGTTYLDFWRKVFQFLLVYGCAWVLTDLRALGVDEDPPVSLQDEIAMGLKDPHLVVYPPLNVINWRTDNRGKLLWAVVKTIEEEQEFLSQKEIVNTWYYFNDKEFRVYQERRKPEEVVKISRDDETNRKAKLIRKGTHSLASVGRLPLRQVLLSEGLWLANRAYLQLVDHVNQDNTLGWALFMSNLAMPVIIGDIDPSQMTQHEAGFLHFPQGTTYTWTEPAGNSFKHAADRVDSLREECFRSMNLQAQGRSMHATPAMQSGRSKQLEMAPAKQVLAGMGDDVRRHMQAVLTDVRDAKGDQDVDPDVRGLSFQQDMTTEEVFAVSSVVGMGIPSDKFEKYLFKKVAKAWMVDANREQLEAVYEEIDAGPSREEREADEFKKKVNMARADVRSRLNQPQMPPGRGGDGPALKSEGSK